jgi:assimilatory nitrate reductase catalytic subunit
VDARYPLRLTTGRLRDQWHGLSRTGTVAALFGHVAEPRVGMNPQDMARRALKSGDLVRVESRRGALHVVLEADESLRSGQAYLPMHWGKRYLGGEASEGVNTVTSSALDPMSRQPELKHAAVKVVAASLPWRVIAMAEGGHALADRLQQLQAKVAFASTVLVTGTHEGVLFRAAHDTPPAAGWLDELDRALGLDGAETLRYDDARRARSRRVRICGERLAAVRIAGEAACVEAAEWMRGSLAEGASVAALRRMLLAPDLRSIAEGRPPDSPVVCRCHGVRENRVDEVLARTVGDAREKLATLQRELACGTECGSCLPELRTRIGNAGPKAGRQAA